jgi:hypothetical protein
MFHHDARHTGRVRRSTVGWTRAYSVLFAKQSDVGLLRQYRDKFLTKTTRGRLYKLLLYWSSREALEVFLDNPALMIEARNLIDANKVAISAVLHGEKGVIQNADEIVSFLNEYARKSPMVLRILAYAVTWEILRKQEQGELFFGFRLN